MLNQMPQLIFHRRQGCRLELPAYQSGRRAKFDTAKADEFGKRPDSPENL
jgi:hypothetical protein